MRKRFRLILAAAAAASLLLSGCGGSTSGDGSDAQTEQQEMPKVQRVQAVLRQERIHPVSWLCRLWQIFRLRMYIKPRRIMKFP